jgi:hypothetical protein
MGLGPRGRERRGGVNGEGGPIPILAGMHVSWRVGKSNTHGRGWLFRGDWRRCARRIETADLHIAKGSISAAVIGRVARAGRLAVFDRFPVVGVGDQVGTPAILVLDDGKGVFRVGAVAVTTAVALPVVVDCKELASGPGQGQSSHLQGPTRSAVLTSEQYFMGTEGPCWAHAML